MVSDQMWQSWAEPKAFEDDILRHYDRNRLWASPEAQRCFRDDLPRALHDLCSRASMGAGFESYFLERLAEFIVDTVMPYLIDVDETRAFAAAEEILKKADFRMKAGLPHREVLERLFFDTAVGKVSPAPVLALTAFFLKHWQCAVVPARFNGGMELSHSARA